MTEVAVCVRVVFSFTPHSLIILMTSAMVGMWVLVREADEDSTLEVYFSTPCILLQVFLYNHINELLSSLSSIP
jgi:hypothetical protein